VESVLERKFPDLDFDFVLEESLRYFQAENRKESGFGPKRERKRGAGGNGRTSQVHKVPAQWAAEGEKKGVSMGEGHTQGDFERPEKQAG